MKRFSDESFDLVLTDPPYGVGADSGVGGFGVSRDKARHYNDNWDTRPSQAVFDEILRISKNAIIFGGNYFMDLLPVNGHWIVWDKTGGYAFDNPFSKCELAWTNLSQKSVAQYQCVQQGFVSEEKERWHPTQKPIKVMAAIINDYSKEGDTILDPFAGSGTTLVAAKQRKLNYVGIEISEKYCEIARKRLSQEVLF